MLIHASNYPHKKHTQESNDIAHNNSVKIVDINASCLALALYHVKEQVVEIRLF